jgi:rRNA-processing protein FCF1
VIAVLDNLIQEGGNLRGMAGPVGGHRSGYVHWVRDAEGSLAFHFDRHDVADLLLTPRYWEILRLQDGNREVVPLVNQEMEARLADLEELRVRYKVLRDRFSDETRRVLVPDTNVFLHYTFFTDAAWSELADNSDPRIIVPLLVLEQLDRLKFSLNQRTAGRAQQVIRRLSLMLDDRGATPTSIPRGGTIEVFVDEPGHVRMASDDAEIVEVARQLASLLPKPARLVTGDLGMRLRAGAMGVEVIPVPEEWQLKGADQSAPSI